MKDLPEEALEEAKRRAANGGFLYPSNSPWAVLEGNYTGMIDWSELMKGRRNIATSEEDAASLNITSPMQRRDGTKLYPPPTPWNKSITKGKGSV